ncbi:MAG: DUF3592 domain-containing protein [Phycisphaerales bacterium]|nr:DUF3592 domain-containing protein [Phycisphaerales bacterium]
MMLNSEHLQWMSAGFQPVDATVVSSSIQQSGRRGQRFSVHVDYAYEFRGDQYRSSRVDYAMNSKHSRYETREEAQRVVARRFGVGEVVEAYVDPNSPSRSVLDNTPPSFRKIILAYVIVIGINGFLSSILWLIDRVLVKHQGREDVMWGCDECD